MVVRKLNGRLLNLSRGQERRTEARLYTFGSDVHITGQSTGLGSFDLRENDRTISEAG